ncbi:MAG: glucuronate isomerase [Synergistetes bacterium]|nr:glucuronate isomerase [Synergistota bacterium]MCX8127547.1 glucuronate isomerase [Synergistota bacterium]MDW8191536.1 glucuronate isomerase [Synergistota bacterium]
MFLGEKYLLTNETAKKIYENIQNLPILDPHNHLEAKEILENKNWNDIWEAEGATDHYVWSLMRRCGIKEEYITGKRTNKEKWLALAKVFPNFAGNPTYEWIHLDLWRTLRIEKIVSEETAEEIWEESKKILESENFKPQEILKNIKAEILCTTDDPSSDLSYHYKASQEIKEFKILPTWRPDNAINIEKEEWKSYVVTLGEIYNEDISNLDGFLRTLWKSHEKFKKHGCVGSDHAILYPYIKFVEKKSAEKIYSRAISGQKLEENEIKDFKSFMMIEFGKMNQETDWVTQLHIGALRDYRDSLFKTLGPNSGGDISTNFIEIAEGLRFFLNEFDSKLKIVLYVLDPTHLPTIATIARAFPNIFLGAPWWFNDSPYGMETYLKYTATVDILYNLAGMVTDSRKLLSFGSRIEVFRRVLSNVLGEMVEKGQIPYKEALRLAERISYSGPKEIFFKL